MSPSGTEPSTPDGRAAGTVARHELTLHGITHGAESVGRLPSGKVCFVPHAIPGERVIVEITDERSRWARARLVAVLDPSPDRVPAPCPYAGPEEPGGPARCGGCVLQHVRPERQAALKRQIVVEQLERIGRFTAPPVADTVAVAPFGYRSHARFAADADGRLGFRRLRSRDVVAVDRCLLLDDGAQQLRTEAGDDWPGVEEVAVRAGTRGRALVVRPGPGGLAPLPAGEAAVALVGAGQPVDLRGDATVVEEVAGHAFAVSPTSFFQPGRPGAEALVRLVGDAAAVGPGDTVLDAYAGVGLFAHVLAAAGASVTAVESQPAAVRDARGNLGDAATVERGDAVRYLRDAARAARAFDVVVVDPPRAGVGTDACRDVAAVTRRALVYVSCDPAAFARDARALVDAGLQLERVTPVDQFAQTAAIETVARFIPTASR
jgi:tRNA/tmRNA/rRNA uracil-C5-methylase (TrmA/RlmC/RlmD family)